MNTTPLKESFGTLSETINGLTAIGYIHDFNVHEECIVCRQTNDTLSPDDFQIDKVYRFEGISDPDDQSILYAISSPKFGLKGTLVDGYGLSSNEATIKLIARLETNTHTKPLTTENVKVDESTPRQKETQEVHPPLVTLNLQKHISQLKKGKNWTEGDRNAAVIFKSETMQIMLLGFHSGAELKSHKANGIISVQVIQGKIKFSTEQESAVLEQGEMITLQPNITHRVLSMTESFFLLTLAINTK
ncbi:cupin domain-containing protein [Flavobacterium sp. SM2513]|uniref:cupin domain-containing protein n=1 Tax=Flavobacterium sp. SM2513 TaxID=3424766 RepID=UPI003D7F6E4D